MSASLTLETYICYKFSKHVFVYFKNITSAFQYHHYQRRVSWTEGWLVAGLQRIPFSVIDRSRISSRPGICFFAVVTQYDLLSILDVFMKAVLS